MRSREVAGVHRAVFFDEPNTAGGLTSYRNIDLGVTGQVIKASPGQIYGWHLFNSHATDLVYVKFYDMSGTPDDMDTPILTVPLGAKGGTGFPWTKGLAFASGIGIRASTGIADNDTGAPGTNQVIVNIGFY